MRSSASASKPVYAAISAGVAPFGPMASAAPQSAMTCRQRAAIWALARSATSSAGSSGGVAGESGRAMALLARGSLQVDRDAAAAQVVVVRSAEVGNAACRDFDDARRERRHELAVVA